jgi:hypothetical protein
VCVCVCVCVCRCACGGGTNSDNSKRAPLWIAGNDREELESGKSTGFVYVKSTAATPEEPPTEVYLEVRSPNRHTYVGACA